MPIYIGTSDNCVDQRISMHLQEFLHLVPKGLLLKCFQVHLVLMQKIMIPYPERNVDQKAVPSKKNMTRRNNSSMQPTMLQNYLMNRRKNVMERMEELIKYHEAPLQI